MDHKFFSDFLREQIQVRGFSVEHLAAQSGVSERHLEALLERNFRKLPAAPYVRGYLMKIGGVLGVKGDELWELYRREAEVKISGPEDRLPGNRFAIRAVSKKWFVLGGTLLILILYLGVNASRLLGAPSLILERPEEETTLTSASVITLAGRVNPEDKLTVDGVEVPVGSTGRFELSYPLQTGLNRIEFTVKRILGRELKVVRQVVYEPQDEPLVPSQ